MLVIPAIDVIEGSCVRLLKGDYGARTRYEITPGEQVNRYRDAGFKRVHVIDLEGARDGFGKERRTVLDIRRSCSLPMQVGGGIRSREDVRQLLAAGIEYLIISTAVTETPDQVEEWIGTFGAERFIVSLDIREGKMRTAGWLKESAEPLDSIVERIKAWGIRQVICTDIDRDGTMEQPNFKTMDLLRNLLPGDTFLIAAGGVCSPGHLESLSGHGVNGAVVGRALYEGRYSMEDFLNAG